jgi:hypothetical protein
MTFDQWTGLIRTLVPAIVAYAVARGWVPAGAAADIGAAIIALAAAGWSWWSNSKTELVKTIAAMPETKVEGNAILLKDSALAQAAQAAKTPNTAGDAR